MTRVSPNKQFQINALINPRLTRLIQLINKIHHQTYKYTPNKLKDYYIYFSSINLHNPHHLSHYNKPKSGLIKI